MGRIKVNCYLDVVILHPEKTPEEREEAVRRADEESKKLTEWPKIE